MTHRLPLRKPTVAFGKKTQHSYGTSAKVDWEKANDKNLLKFVDFFISIRDVCVENLKLRNVPWLYEGRDKLKHKTMEEVMDMIKQFIDGMAVYIGNFWADTCENEYKIPAFDFLDMGD